MIVYLDVSAQLKRCAEKWEPFYELPEKTTLHKFLFLLTHENGEKFKKLILDGNASIRRSLLVAINDRQVSYGRDVELNDQDRVQVYLPISGG